MTMTMADLLFYLLAIVVVGSALVVAFSRNIVRSAFALLGAFFGVAGLYVYLSADFLAAIQVLVYVGGILVLILFAVMLTSRIKDVTVTNRSAGRPVGLLLAGALLAFLLAVALKTPWAVDPGAGYAASTASMGDALLGQYVLPFEIVSVLLVAALIGAVTLVRKEEK
jgi:NADH-quinone oxidoreductase subunit J